ncbi:hypothetical protein PIB30_049146 [Stylosanthes scabra]|uniref:Aminotransferase-like plant mobile domain-containing protein n=1 Tax=Stylosanthes scabra TaxID=79078 RepID=A0ABU6YGJ9_9FABA|nr:hypothetical protein [Stylosanthes scabra]
MDVGGGEEVEGAGRSHGRGRGRGRARHPAAVGDRQPAARDGDINRLTKTTHVVGAVDFQVSRMLELRRGSVVVSPPPSIVSYVEEAGFGGLLRMRDFDIDSGLLSAFVERWRPETHTF